MEFSKQLKLFRDSIPIGIQQAIKILKQNNGDVNKSIEQAKNEYQNQLICEVKVDSKMAEEILFEVNYNLIEAKKRIIESRLSTTEIILSKNSSNEQKAIQIYRAIFNKYSVTHEECEIDSHDKTKFNTFEKDFIMVYDWLGYEDYEGFSDAIHQDCFEDVIKIFGLKYGMTEFAKNLENANDTKNQIIKKYDFNIKKGNIHYLYRKELEENSIIIKASQFLFDERLDKIYESIITYIKQHINKFP
ncbi:hypothetical protein [Aureibacter tunicatorum]|uniref:Vacuolar-type H+-ATPase subunit H n=1 Tax=Aureibacter tunicatorum TaxID=866807 RepID=A0AAE4BSS3_9BACT|nr:hypothetical protein [Aureibacter tunicatorum]MDR6240071.1 vacuolar-type H+-ATPase subunit H [Aureibacter tunicatorum]BDD04542.1 hypothetical protein AUTU_20250 [Aureibacter tunicatorum]